MRFLSNENFPLPSSRILQNDGHELYLIAQDCPGISDLEVISLAVKLDAVILTFDKDYGEIIFKHKITKPPSVIFFRFKGGMPTTAGQLLAEMILNDTIRIENRFTVIEETGIRQKKYPE
jgi:predicted nuclease of predicted toxin-antitoxin system